MEGDARSLHHCAARDDDLPDRAASFALAANSWADRTLILECFHFRAMAASETLVAVAQKVRVQDKAQRVALAQALC